MITTPDGQPLIVLVHKTYEDVTTIPIAEEWLCIDPRNADLWYSARHAYRDKPGPPRREPDPVPKHVPFPPEDAWDAWTAEPRARREEALATWIQMTEPQTAIANDLMTNGSRLHDALDAARRLAP